MADKYTGDAGLALGNQDSPVDEGRDMWPGMGESIKDTEPGAILRGRVLTRWGEELLDTGGIGWR